MTATNPASVRPKSLRREGTDRLVIDWDDGHHSVYTWQHIRANCPCANCREEKLAPPDPFRILSANELAAGPLMPTAMNPIGHYAYQIVWNDGHDTGIFTLEHLRELCQCDQCHQTRLAASESERVSRE
jgi:DUF971 family protein